MHVFFSYLAPFFSSRLWCPALAVAGVLLTFFPTPSWVDMNHVVIGVLVFAVLTILIVSMSSYDVEGVRQYVQDILIDIVVTSLPTLALTVVLTAHLLGFWSLDGVVFLASGVLIGAVDLVVSLKAGASKLLEMDKQRITGLNS